jgi:hypothetical protein
MLSQSCIKRLLKNLSNADNGIIGDKHVDISTNDIIALTKHLKNELLPSRVPICKNCEEVCK